MTINSIVNVVCLVSVWGVLENKVEFRVYGKI